MSHWNHRVVKKTYPPSLPNGEPEDQYSIRETFYNDDGSIFAYTADPIDLACESLEALLEYVEWCAKAVRDAINDPNRVLVDGEVKFVSHDPDDMDGALDDSIIGALP